jgi:maltooligosyltrehalose trehalohydrolase
LGDGRCRFLVWAPKAKTVALKLVGSSAEGSPAERLLPMNALLRGYFELIADSLQPGARYLYRLDGQRDRPDPASRFQPDGVHRASAVVDRNFAWTDDEWRGISLHEYITYELHVGAFTPEGTFEAAIAHLDELRELGVTALELMPVAQFPGGRNWGYDGVCPFAVQNTYGGPRGLKRLVDAAHVRGLAVVLDVVYNHLGPEGNYLAEFGHYFTDRHHTPWGQALNFDGRHSDEVRRFFIENALHWIDEYHIDALRLDAIHAIYDFSALPFLEELAGAVRLEGQQLHRQVFTIAESNLNDARLITPAESGGYGLDAQWSDDLHHALRHLLAGDRAGYFADFHGLADVVKAYRDGWVHDGGYSEYRGRRHGNSARHVAPERLVVFSQNHDQVGNRLRGDRLSEALTLEQLKLAAAVVLLSPYQPLLFMGEEYGETARFQYFISHTDAGLVEAVRRGRQEEFRRFQWTEAPPDPQDESTFRRSKLNHSLKKQGPHRVLRDYYAALLRLRAASPALAFPMRDRVEVIELEPAPAMAVRCWAQNNELLTIFHFGAQAATAGVCLPPGVWECLLDSTAAEWLGPAGTRPECIESTGEVRMHLPPQSALVFRRQE